MTELHTDTMIGRALALKEFPPRVENLKVLIGRTIIIVLSIRGGSGKTTTTINVAEMLLSAGCTVRVETTDTGNADTIMAGLTKGAAIDLSTPEGQDAVINLFANLGSEVADHVIIDTGAGPTAERFVASNIAMLDQFAREAGFTLVIIRPITTSHVTQVHTKNFIEKFKPDRTACIVVRNMSGPRYEEDYKNWTDKPAIQALHDRFVQVDLLPLRAVVLDNMLSFNMTPTSILNGDFSLAGANEAEAKKIFTTAIRLATGEWLLKQQAMFEDALVRAIRQVKEPSRD
jgi:hypothetical protein